LPLSERLGRAGAAAVLLVAFAAAAARGASYAGVVVSAPTGEPIAGAAVTLQGRVVATDATGAFRIEGEGPSLLRARAIGHGRADVVVPQEAGDPVTVALPELRPKALYLSIFGIGDARLRSAALALADATEVNALVIDLKSDYGKIPYASSIPLARESGALSTRTIRDEEALVASLHARGIYVIARIVAFKDRLAAAARPDLAVKTRDGTLWTDRENSAWLDPLQEEARRYVVDVAVEAARTGVDEIQFDYVRFPDAVGLRFAGASTQASRIAAIGGFLEEARQRLVPYNVFLSADVFGYVCWNPDDTMIGQRIEDLAPLVDYVSPMLYPSSFQFGIPGYRQPVAHPYEIVRRSLERARARTGSSPLRWRPWLQAFRDYAFDRRAFDGAAIRAQIRAAEEFGASGWMLWSPANVYHADGLGKP
jgi:hypothetical protein